MGGWTAGQSSATPTSGRELLPAPGRGAHPGGHLSGAPGRKEAPLRHSGRSGAPKASHAFSSTAPAVWAKPAGPGSPRASAPSCLIHIHHIHEGDGGGASLARGAPPPTWDPAPAEAQAPVGRPRLPLRGGSFHLVTTQKCVAAAPPSVVPAPGCVCGVSSLRGKEQRGQGKDCSSPLGKVG